MGKPIYLARVIVKYKKSETEFEMVSSAKIKEEITDYGRYIIARNISISKKNLNNIYQSIFDKCKILQYKIIKQIGSTNE